MGVVEVSSETWDAEVSRSKGLLIVEFWHEGCTWCKHIDPFLRDLDQEYKGRARFAKFDVLASEKHWEIANGFGITGSPTLIFFCNGNPVGELVGFKPKQALKGAVEGHLENCDAGSARPCVA